MPTGTKTIRNASVLISISSQHLIESLLGENYLKKW